MKFVKKFFGKLGWLLGSIILACICLLWVFLGVGSAIDTVVSVVKIAGHGSLIRGIVLAPFFVFGCIQIIRGFIKVLESSNPCYCSKKTGKCYDLSSLYFLAMVIGYFAVLSAFPAFGAPSEDYESEYEAKYEAGYETGYRDGLSDPDSYMEAYDEGYYDGYEKGSDNGYWDGYEDGNREGSQYGWQDNIHEVADYFAGGAVDFAIEYGGMHPEDAADIIENGGSKSEYEAAAKTLYYYFMYFFNCEYS